MMTLSKTRSWFLALAVILLGLAVARIIIFPSRASAGSGEPYQVELVQNDPYKVQIGMNQMAARGWTYISSISRTDGKVLLVFHRAD